MFSRAFWANPSDCNGAWERIQLLRHAGSNFYGTWYIVISQHLELPAWQWSRTNARSSSYVLGESSPSRWGLLQNEFQQGTMWLIILINSGFFFFCGDEGKEEKNMIWPHPALTRKTVIYLRSVYGKHNAPESCGKQVVFSSRMRQQNKGQSALLASCALTF